MSTHVLDVSGARPLSLCINDPARTGATLSSKAGDDVVAVVSGAREVRLALPPGAKIQRRRYIRRTHAVDGGGKVVKVDGEYVYEETPYDELVLVLSGSVTVFGRTSADPAAVAEGEPPVYEGTPHTTLSVRRWTDQHFTESGELLEELDLADYVPASMRP